jgi:hypothetical protein
MMQVIWKRAILLCAALLAACTIQLVPSYDQALVEGLNDANTAALTLFASVETGSPTTKFSDYEHSYAEIIGKFDALQQRAASRQIPPLAARLSKLKITQTYCNSATDPTSCLNVSPSSLNAVLATLRRMRDTHKSSGLAPDAVDLFEGRYKIAVAQALTVENALKR